MWKCAAAGTPIATPHGDVAIERLSPGDRVEYVGDWTYDILPASDTGTYVVEGALVGSTLR